MALGAVEELGGVGGMVESTLMDGMEETRCNLDNTFKKG